MVRLPFSGIVIYREPLIVGCKDKEGNPIHAIRLVANGPVYVVPEYFDKLVKEIQRNHCAIVHG